MAYITFVVWARFRGVAAEADLDVASLSLGPATWGVLIAAGIFVSIILHEMAHALIAQTLGVKVKSITLNMLGGVALMERVPSHRYGEFRLSIVGPMVSLALAGAFAVFGARTASPDLAFYSYWLSNANLALGIFNLLPAFPLDGGRALRSLLAARHGELYATQVAVRVSKTLSWCLGILGLLSFNMILVLIAVFIHSAAQAELFIMMSRGMLQGMRVGEVALRAEPVGERTPISEAAELMVAQRISVLPVASMTGAPFMIRLQRIRRVPRAYWNTTLVTDVMEPAVRALDSGESLGDVILELAGSPGGVLPVREDGRITGVLRTGDLSEIVQLRGLELQRTQAERAGKPRDFGKAA